MHEIETLITGEQAGKSLQSLLRGQLKVSYSQYKRLKFHEGIYVDGCRENSGYILQEGQTVRLVFRQEALQDIKKPAPGLLPLQIAYEDADLLVVSKPAPLPAIASKQGGETLENRVFSYLGEPADFVYRPINRLDKGTSGLMLVAKNAHIQARMQSLLHTDEFVREYLAIACGSLPEKSGRIELPLAKGEGIRRRVDQKGQSALTFYEVLLEGKNLSLVALRLHTGRTHQIRVHLAAQGCPVLGDFLYGQENEKLPGRFALHANKIRFFQPVVKKWVEIEAPIPAEMQEIIDDIA